MPRVVSFIVLLAILLLMSAVFFQVMAHFVVPLFLAAVLVVVFKPLHAWVVAHIPGHTRVAALATTLLILLAVLLPTAWLGWKAAIELRGVYNTYLVPRTFVKADAARTGDNVGAADAPNRGQTEREKLSSMIVNRAPKVMKDLYSTVTGDNFDATDIEGMIKQARGLIGNIAVGGAQIALRLLFGLAIMMLALYYFLADGPRMLESMMKMSPLDDVYERELLDKFANVSRAVVVASLASAVAQALLAGIGYYFALNEGAPIFLLTMLTMVLAIVPFAGAAAIWLPTALWIYLYQPVLENGKPVLDAAGAPVHGDTFAAIGLAIYGACVVSTIDNVIKPLVLHGQSNLHPLVALISILGGVQTLGPIGILVGPMLVAFIQAIVAMVNKELLHFSDGSRDAKRSAPSTPLPLGEATEILAEGAVAGGPGVLEELLAPTATEPPAAHPGKPAPAPAKGRRTSKQRRRK